MRRRGGDDFSSAASSKGGWRQIGTVKGEWHQVSRLSFFSSLFFLRPPYSQANAAIQQPIMGRKQPQSTVPPGSGQSAYRSGGGPVHTAQYGWYHSVLQTLVSTNQKHMKSHYNKTTASMDLLKMLKTMRIQVILTVHFQKS
ncbi:hypothetical protein BHE74_00028728 [Ensete ventricosum]|nr:hypothetical protein GW17_00031307 [Ensete ventricosum]RWW64057.1 hypothetical protein BHE74_00028728 [Ensete ventricosum]